MPMIKFYRQVRSEGRCSGVSVGTTGHADASGSSDELRERSFWWRECHPDELIAPGSARRNEDCADQVVRLDDDDRDP
ncbi:unnamed protein product, partial [Amoebophrya sp. A25]|eukprot:GSA25T00004176001.1